MNTPKLTISPNGTQRWYLNGVYHREDGPAFTYPDGVQEWWLNGRYYPYKNQFQRDANISDEDMTALLLRYNWK